MNFKTLLIFVLSLLVAHSSFAQFNIKNDIEDKSIKNASIDTIERKDIAIMTVNEAYLKKQKQNLRDSRNTFTATNGLTFSQYGYTNWASGGENSLNGRIYANLKHIYKLDDFDVTTSLDAAYAMATNDSMLYKTEDYWKIVTNVNYSFTDHLYYNLNVEVNSQFADGYTSLSDEKASSGFLSPGYVVLGLGFNYKLDNNRYITFSPITGNVLVVQNEYLSSLGSYGVTPGKKAKFSFGASAKIDWKQTIIKDSKNINGGTDLLTYRVSASSFWDYKNMPTLSWQNWLDLNIYKYFNVNFTCTVYFNDKVDTPKGSFWQFSQVLGVGLKYTFASKN